VASRAPSPPLPPSTPLQGYIGPLPLSVLDPRATLRFEGIPVAKGKAMDEMVATKRACVTLPEGRG
jgi:hypothetical protein